jgi:hypothetical protein
MATKSAKGKNAESFEGRVQGQISQPAMPGLQADILALQRTAGNQAVTQLLQPSGIGSTSFVDVQDQVETTQNSSLKPLPSAHASPADAKGLPASVRSVLGSSGQPLDPATLAWMESCFGYDFSSVRIHTNTQAAASARAINASAFTVGRDIVFGDGSYAPNTAAGQKLLAHELAHTVQQSPYGHSIPAVSPQSSLEHSADIAAQSFVNGSPMVHPGSTGVGIARQLLEEPIKEGDIESLVREIEIVTNSLRLGVLSGKERENEKEGLRGY